MKLRPANSLIVVAVVLIATCALGQLTVDTTGPHSGSDPRNAAASGGGGSTGRKLPIQVALQIQGALFNANGKTVLDFILTNSGNDALTLPVSPSPGDVQSAKSFMSLALYITSDKRHEKVLQGGADPHNPFVILYGSHSSPATFATLHRGESIRVRAEVALPHVSAADQTSTAVLVAHAGLYDVTMKTIDGKIISDTQDIGSADSPEYTPQTLFKSPN